MPARPLQTAALDVHGICRACSEIGGDFFDFFPLPHGRHGLVIADVSGKGVAGALLAASLQAAVHGGLGQDAPIPERLQWLNTFLLERSPVRAAGCRRGPHSGSGLAHRGRRDTTLCRGR